MRYRAKQDKFVEAIEWTGENLKAIQDFLFPESPLTQRQIGEIKNLGINVINRGADSAYTPTTLAFAKQGDYLVKTTGGTEIWAKAVFEQHYELAVFEPDTLEQVG